MSNIDIIIKQVGSMYEARIPEWPTFHLRKHKFETLKAALPSAIVRFDPELEGTQFHTVTNYYRPQKFPPTVEKETASDSDIWNI